MINLYNAKSHTLFKCYIVEYENAKEDWCLLKILHEVDNKLFEAFDPAIQTTDLPILFDWFKCLSEKRLPRYSYLTFIEPCIGFANTIAKFPIRNKKNSF